MTETSNKSVSTSRLGNCEVCANSLARYACPKCEVKTCSVHCVQIHKRELDCDGKRDRTKFMPLSAMTEREFLSDYCFLEECTRYAANRKGDPSKRFTQHQKQLPLPLHRLRAAAQQRGTRLQFLLANFSRHAENTTYLDWKLRRIYWRIEWLFVQASGETTQLSAARCDEAETLATLLQPYLDLRQETARDQRKALQLHQSAGIGQLSVWLRAEGVRCSGRRCHRLVAHKTLRDNLAGKTIVEFPTIYVSYEQRPPTGYEIVDSDEELEQADGAATEPANKRSQPPSPTQPAAKRGKTAAAAASAAQSTEQPELHDIYALAASFGAHEDSCGSSSDEALSEDEMQPN